MRLGLLEGIFYFCNDGMRLIVIRGSYGETSWDWRWKASGAILSTNDHSIIHRCSHLDYNRSCLFSPGSNHHTIADGANALSSPRCRPGCSLIRHHGHHMVFVLLDSHIDRRSAIVTSLRVEGTHHLLLFLMPVIDTCTAITIEKEKLLLRLFGRENDWILGRNCYSVSAGIFSLRHHQQHGCFLLSGRLFEIIDLSWRRDRCWCKLW